MKKFLFAALLLTLTALGALVWWAQDANRLKPQLEASLSDALEMPVTIDGNVSWQLWPPLSATAERLRGRNSEGRTYTVERLALAVRVSDLFSSVADWQVESLELTNVQVQSDTGLTELPALEVIGYRPGRWADVIASGVHNGIPFEVAGEVLHVADVEPLMLEMREMSLTVAETSADCEGQLAATGTDWPSSAGVEELISTELLREYTWTGHCDIPSTTINGELFRDVSLDFSNGEKAALTTLVSERFFTGKGSAAVTIAHDSDRLQWSAEVDLSDVDAQQLTAWLGRPLDWQGQLQVDGNAQSSGNSPASLLNELHMDIAFDGGQGAIDISEIKARLSDLAEHTSVLDSISKWPETWHYQYFVGAWRANGSDHTLDFALDNLTTMAEGKYLALDDRLDMDVSLVFGNDPAYTSFDINPILVGLPIPGRCKGPIADVQCKLDQRKAVANIGRALTSGEDNGLRAKLEQKIDEEVPEEYRDTARALLDLLSGSSGD